MRTESIGLCLIGKDEEKNIERVLRSVAGYVDRVFYTDTGSTDKTLESFRSVCNELDIDYVLTDFKWEDDFGKARNFNFAQADTDWILWLDCDDTLENPEYIRKYIEFARERSITDIWLTYRYLVQDEKDVTVHSKSRIVRNGLYEWTEKAMIHENMFVKPEFKDQHKSWLPSDQSMKVRHWATIEDLKASGIRNLKILQTQYEKEGDKKDPRTVFLLGREHHAQDHLEDAKRFLEYYLELVPYGHERVNALDILFNIAERKSLYQDCEKYGFEAIRSDSSHPVGYLLVATSYHLRGVWQKAIDWIEQSLRHKPKLSGGEIQGSQRLKEQSVLILAECYQKLEQYEKAKAVLLNYLQDNPEREEDINSDIINCDVGIATRKELESFVVLANTALTTNKLETIKTLINVLPYSLQTAKEVLRLKRAVGLFTQWDTGSVVIFCGGNVEEWDQDSIKTGLGGSETAVVYMAMGLTKLGYKVTVYSSVPEKRVFGDVTYLPIDSINMADKFNVFISWRNVRVFDKIDIFAKQRLLWLHDVPQPKDYTEEVLSKIDKIIVLSEYHRSLLPSVPNEKFYISANGIDSGLVKLSSKPRKPRSIIYSSAADRGLETLVDMLLELDIEGLYCTWAYGWESFDVIRPDKASQHWKQQLIAKMDKLGMRQLGRIGKKELYQEYQQHQFWVYPTAFQEISCISCMEAQANGCIPITTGFAALAETQIFGVKERDISKLKKALLNRLLAEPSNLDDIKHQAKIALEVFDWQKVVNYWDKDLLSEFKAIQRDDLLVSVICITIRPGVFRVLREQLEKQTYRNMELIVIDGRYAERKKEVAEYMKDFKFPYLHLPDPNRDKAKFPYGLFHADNAGLFTANGELVVFLQDFIEIPENGIEKYVKLYKDHPDRIYTGVDDRWHYKADELDSLDKIDIFKDKGYEKTTSDFTSPRIRIGGAIRRSTEPMEWELNWSAAPKEVLMKLGGWNNDWDRGFAFDNSEIALRFVYAGGTIMVDETNKANALSHWDISNTDALGVPTRNKLPNDNRYATFMRQLQTAKQPKYILDFEEPSYPNYILREIKEWKRRKD